MRQIFSFMYRLCTPQEKICLKHSTLSHPWRACAQVIVGGLIKHGHISAGFLRVSFALAKLTCFGQASCKVCLIGVTAKLRTNNCYSAWQKEPTGLFLRLCAAYVPLMYTALTASLIAPHFFKPIANSLSKSEFQF